MTYSADQLDRDVVAEDQIRLVIQTFKDRLFTELFPGRRIVPKTLIFAKDDSHAEDIVHIASQEMRVPDVDELPASSGYRVGLNEADRAGSRRPKWGAAYGTASRRCRISF